MTSEIKSVISRMGLNELLECQRKLSLMVNPLPSPPLHEVEQSRKEFGEWVDRQLVIGEYDDLKTATQQIMRMCKGKMNPQYITEGWERREQRSSK